MTGAPSACMTSNFRSARSEVLAEDRIGRTLEVPERLVKLAAQAQVRRNRGNVGRRRIEVDEIVLEQLVAIEACGGDSFELLTQRSTH
jgi:hypothetical protein